MNLDVIQRHHLTRMDLARLAQLLDAIDADIAAGDQHFTRAAAVAKTNQLQQLVELHVVALKFELKLLHGVSLSGQSAEK